MYGFLVGVLILDSLVLTTAILLQAGQGGGLASLGGGAGTEQFMGGRQATTLLTKLTWWSAAIFLFLFGTGPVKGFAVTLTFGLLANLFTAVFVSRMIFDWILSRKPSRTNQFVSLDRSHPGVPMLTPASSATPSLKPTASLKSKFGLSAFDLSVHLKMTLKDNIVEARYC